MFPMLSKTDVTPQNVRLCFEKTQSGIDHEKKKKNYNLSQPPIRSYCDTVYTLLSKNKENPLTVFLQEL